MTSSSTTTTTATAPSADTAIDHDRLPPPFRHLAGANLAAQAAEQIALAAAPMVAVLAFAAGPREIGLLTAAQTLPFLLLSIPFGLLADRRSRRGLMLAAEGVRIASLVLLLAATASGTLSLPVLALLGFLGAAGTVAFSVAAPAVVPTLVPVRLLPRANGRIELARSLAYAGGPALAGALVAWAGASLAFAGAAALSAAAFALLVGLPRDRIEARPARHPLAELRDGARFVWGHALLKPMLLTAVVWNLAWCVMQAAYVPHAMTTLGLGAGGVGTTLALYGAGMIVGALLAPRLMARLATGTAICVGPVVSVAAALAMAATLLLPTPVLAAVSFFLFGAGPIVWTISTTTLRQTVTPAPMLGRVGAIFLTANAGARPIGSVLGAGIAAIAALAAPGWTGSAAGSAAAAAAAAGAAACLVIAAIGFVVQAWLVLGSALRTVRELKPAN